MTDPQDLDLDQAQIHTNPPMMRVVDDHEREMALSQVYRAAKCAMEIHRMLQMVDQLEGWMQAKITLAADYLEAVSSNLEYDLVSASMQPPVMNLNLNEAQKTQVMDPKMVHALRSLSKQFNRAFSKADLAHKEKGEQIDVVANALSDITDRIVHHKTPFSDPAATRLGKLERELLDHFEPVLKKTMRKEAQPGELRDAIHSSVRKLGKKMVKARADSHQSDDDSKKKK